MATTPHPHRLSRKELRQPDEFITFVEAAGDYIASNLKLVIIGAVGLLALIVIGVGVRFYLSSQDRALAEAFYQAASAYDQKDYVHAQSQFAALAKAHPSSSLGRLARFYVANIYLTSQQPAKARDELQKYLAANDRPAFREMALMQLGIANEELGDYTAARKAYEQAAAMKGPEQGRAELNVARLLGRAGDKK